MSLPPFRMLSALEADNVGFRLLDEVQYPDAPE